MSTPPRVAVLVTLFCALACGHSHDWSITSSAASINANLWSTTITVHSALTPAGTPTGTWSCAVDSAIVYNLSSSQFTVSPLKGVSCVPSVSSPSDCTFTVNSAMSYTPALCSSDPYVTVEVYWHCSDTGLRKRSTTNSPAYFDVHFLQNDLCGVTTGRPTPFNTTAFVSPHADYHVISPFVWLDHPVYVAVQYNLPWAQKAPDGVALTKLYLSGPAVNTSAWDGVIYTDSGVNSTWIVTSGGCDPSFSTTASAVAKNSILCFTFKLLPGYFIRDHYLRITAGTEVTSMPPDDRRSVATESVAFETSAIVNVIGAMDTAAAPAEAAERLAIAAPEQKQTVRYEYQYRSVPAVAAAAAFVATALVASAAFFAARASRAARAASL